MAGDPFFNQVVFLSGWEGANGSTPTPEESSFARALNYSGNSQVDTGQVIIGTSSLLLDGVGDFTNVPQSNELTLGSQDFTIETFVRFSSLPGGVNQCFVSNYDATGNQRSYGLLLNTSNELNFLYSTDGIGLTNATGAWGPSINTDIFVSVSRQGANLYLHVDGVQVGSTFNISTDTIFDSLAEVTKFGILDIGTNAPMFGHMDETRITIGTGRYNASSYTVPTEPFPRFLQIDELIINNARHAHLADNVVISFSGLPASLSVTQDFRVPAFTEVLFD